MDVIRQGDVLLVPLSRSQVISEGLTLRRGRAIPREEPGIVLAHGEATGHHHHVKSLHARFRTYGSGRTRRQILHVHKTGAQLEHQEHSAIALAPGKYEVRRQTEYTPPERKRSASATTQPAIQPRTYVYD